MDRLASEAGITRDRPRADGVALGRALAALATAGRVNQPDLPYPCATCAFRLGCMTNTMPATLLLAFNCSLGVDDAPFACHHGMSNGQPQEKCAGWMAAQATDWPDVDRIMERLKADMDALPDQDRVRADYDAWIERIDPTGDLDDYQRGRLWLRDDPCGLLAAAQVSA